MPPRRVKKKATTKKAAPALPQDAEQLGAVLQQILTPDNDVIRDGMRILRAFIASPVCVPALMQQLSENGTTGCRQLAAIALRKCIRDHWSSLGPDLRAMIRSVLLERMLAEPSVNVRNSTVYLISTIAREDIPKAQWPELMEWVIQACGSSESSHNDFGLLLLRLLLKATPKSLAPYRDRAHAVFVSFLGTKDMRLLKRALVGLDAVFDMFKTRLEINSIAELVPTFLNLFETAAADEEVEVVDAVMVILSSVSDPDFPLGDENFSRLTTLMCNALASPDVPYSVREKALVHVTDELQANPAFISRLSLVDMILTTSFSVIMQIEDEPSFSSEDAPHRLGSQLLYVAAENLPKRQVIDACLPHISRMIASQDWRERCGALLAFTTLMECAAPVISSIDNNVTFRQIITVVCGLISDPVALVRASASLCLHNIATVDDDNHPLFDMHEMVVPPLIAAIRSDGLLIERTFALSALDSICEHLNSRIMPYYAEIMSLCQGIFSSATDPGIMRCAISVVKAVAVACRTDFIPYFPALVEFIRPMLSFTDDEQLEMRASATECLGKAAFAVGVDNWPADFGDILNSVFAGFVVEGTYDYTLHSLSFVFFERVFAAWGRDASPEVVRAVVQKALDTINSREGISGFDDDDDEGGDINGFDDESEAEEGEVDAGETAAEDRAAAVAEIDAEDAARGGDDDEDDMEEEFDPRVNVDTEAMNVKLEAAQLLITCIEAMGPGIGEDLFTEIHEDVKDLCAFPYALMRRSMLAVLNSVAECVAHMFPTPGGVIKGIESPLHPEAEKIMRPIIDTVVAVVVNDNTESVVTIALQVFSCFLKLYGIAAMPIDNPPYAPSISFYSDFMSTLELIAQEKGPCQVGRDLVDIDADSGFEVLDSLCDLLGVFSDIMGPKFITLFNTFLPYFSGFLDERRPSMFRSSTVGTLGEMIDFMGPVTHIYSEELVRTAQRFLSSPIMDLACNAAFLTGAMALNIGPSLEPYVGSLLAGIMGFLERTREAEANNTHNMDSISASRDNIASALTKLSQNFPGQADPSAVLPVVVSLIPLKTDFSEGNITYPRLPALAALAPATLPTVMPGLIRGYAEAFASDLLDDAVRVGMATWMRQIAEANGPQVQEVLSAVPKEHADAFMYALNTGGAPPVDQ